MDSVQQEDVSSTSVAGRINKITGGSLGRQYNRGKKENPTVQKSALKRDLKKEEDVQKEEDDADKNNGKGKKTPNNEKFKEFDKK